MLVIGDHIIETPNVIRSRAQETPSYRKILVDYLKSGANWQIVASHLGILRAGGTVIFLDTTFPDALITHMLEDAQPVVVLTRGRSAGGGCRCPVLRQRRRNASRSSGSSPRSAWSHR